MPRRRTSPSGRPTPRVAGAAARAVVFGWASWRARRVRVASGWQLGSFDGHANCFVESGDGKGLLIDFNYDTQPLPGRYPLPFVGPMSLRELR